MSWDIVFALDWLLVDDLLILDLSSGPLLAHLLSSLKGSEWLRLNFKLFVGFIGRCRCLELLVIARIGSLPYLCCEQ